MMPKDKDLFGLMMSMASGITWLELLAYTN